MGKESYPKEFVVTVTSKGQVTLPAEFRKLAKIKEGSKLGILVDADGTARLKRKLTLDEIAGSLTDMVLPEFRNFTPSDVDDAIGEAVSEKWDRVAAQSKTAKDRAA